MGKTEIDKVISEHMHSGRTFTVNNLKCFALDQGSGETVLCLHGVPTSSYLFRKVVQEIANAGYRGVAVDFPGFGFSDRPDNYEYSFLNLARFASKATKALGIDKYHLLVHDVGGPIGFALAAENRESIRSITILNTWIDVVNFKKPLPMRPFEKPVLGELELAALQHPTWQLMFNKMGVKDHSEIPKAEVDAYIDILKRDDGGKAFLKLMRNFDDTELFRDLCYQAVQDVPYPVQSIWGADDPFLTLSRYGQEIKRIAGLNEIKTVKSKHFVTEEFPVEIARMVVEQIKQTADTPSAKGKLSRRF